MTTCWLVNILIDETGFLFCAAQDIRAPKGFYTYLSGCLCGTFFVAIYGINKDQGIRFEIFFKSGTVKLGPLELIIYLNFCDSQFE